MAVISCYGDGMKQLPLRQGYQQRIAALRHALHLSEDVHLVVKECHAVPADDSEGRAVQQ